MSFDIYVLVPAKSWPTARQLDNALVASNYPVRLGERPSASWNEPLAPVPGEPIRFTVESEAQAQALGREIGTEHTIPIEIAMPMSMDGVDLDPDFGMKTIADAERFNQEQSDFDTGPVAKAGDHLVWFSHHSDQRNYNAAMYVLAALISKFDGYGFERQGMSHGRDSFVEELLGSLYDDPVENPYG